MREWRPLDGMEILVELLMGLLQVVAELGLQLLLEILVELGMHSRSLNTVPARKQSNPWVAGLGYFLLGALVGMASLWPFPATFIDSEGGRVINLLITPVVAGLIMGALGAWRLRRGQELIRIDRFAYGYVFALGMGLMRFQFALI